MLNVGGGVFIKIEFDGFDHPREEHDGQDRAEDECDKNKVAHGVSITFFIYNDNIPLKKFLLCPCFYGQRFSGDGW